MYLIDGNVLYEKMLNRYDPTDECCMMAFLASRVDAAPVVHGRWEYVRLRKNKNGRSVRYIEKSCSECHSVVGKKTIYTYCPHCGSKNGDK